VAHQLANAQLTLLDADSTRSRRRRACPVVLEGHAAFLADAHFLGFVLEALELDSLPS
jgi:hypothetical protein